MTETPTSPFLRRVLLLDAVASAAMGALLALAAGPLAALLGLPEPLLRAAGIVLLPWAAFVGWLAGYATVTRPLLWVAVIGNALWAVDSVALLFTGWVEPTGIGAAVVLGQATAVAVFAELQAIALRRTTSASPA